MSRRPDVDGASMSAEVIPQPGIYRHFKGGCYQVIGVARHAETEEPLVVYRLLYGDLGLWVRPLSAFNDEVLVQGRRVRRFSRIDSPLTWPG